MPNQMRGYMSSYSRVFYCTVAPSSVDAIVCITFYYTQIDVLRVILYLRGVPINLLAN